MVDGRVSMNAVAVAGRLAEMRELAILCLEQRIFLAVRNGDAEECRKVGKQV